MSHVGQNMARYLKLDPLWLLLTETLFLFSELTHTSYTLPLPPPKLTYADFPFHSLPIPALINVKCPIIAAQKQKAAIPSRTKCYLITSAPKKPNAFNHSPNLLQMLKKANLT